MFPAPCRSRAIAAQTHESIPPLNSTTALLASVLLILVSVFSQVSMFLQKKTHRPTDHH
jgi:hypothetical protein